MGGDMDGQNRKCAIGLCFFGKKIHDLNLKDGWHGLNLNSWYFQDSMVSPLVRNPLSFFSKDIQARISTVFRWTWLPLSVLILTQCFWDTTPEPPLPAFTVPGMAWIRSEGQAVLLGSTASFAKASEESPRMKALFTYSFHLDSVEVTQGQWEAIMQRPAYTEKAYGKSDSLPAYNVTWFDAVLYCNAKSRSENRDTVYSYVEVVYDNDGHARDIKGLTTHYERVGYRLPTEAEWEYAARCGTQTDFPWGGSSSEMAEAYAWFNSNSGGTPHPVATKKPNAWGLFDLTGNVMEWVNDWKGPFADLTVSNFIGQMQPNAQFEKPIKGGAFPYSQEFLRPSGRSTTYATQPASLAGYVGFRCALGAIPNGTMLNGSGGTVQAPQTSIELLSSRWNSMIPKSSAKLAFVNATQQYRTLHLAEYSPKGVQLSQLGRDTVVFAPVFSPDGNWIAYGDAYEGMHRPGKVSLVSLDSNRQVTRLEVPSAYLPRWQVLAGEDTVLVFATSGVDNTDPRWTTASTWKISVRGGKFQYPAIQISDGAFHDGLSRDGNTLLTGYRRLLQKSNLNTDSSRVHTFFTFPENGKSWEDTSQVCNVSLHPQPEQGNRFLFLDFGSSRKSALVGREYGIHEIAFLGDPSGKITGYFGPPQGFVSFDDLEWSNHPGYAASAFKGESGDKQVVGIVAIPSGEILPLVRSGNLEQPALWLDPSSADSKPVKDFVDSLFQYENPPKGDAQTTFAAKMKTLLLQRKESEIVILGSSRMMSGVAPQYITAGKAVNLAATGQGPKLADEIYRHYVGPHYPKLKAVVFDLILGWLNLEDTDYILTHTIHGSMGLAVDSAHQYWKGGVPPELDSVALNFSNAQTGNFDSLGTMASVSQNWGSSPPYVEAVQGFTMESPIVQSNLAFLRKMIHQITGGNVALVITLMPESPLYPQTRFFGKYGPDRVTGPAMIQSIRALCEESPLCRLYDANQAGQHDYTSDDAINEDHLSSVGALRYTPRLDSVLQDALGSRAP
jgi:uncharacterized protein (TIGR02171 family)